MRGLWFLSFCILSASCSGASFLFLYAFHHLLVNFYVDGWDAWDELLCGKAIRSFLECSLFSRFDMNAAETHTMHWIWIKLAKFNKFLKNFKKFQFENFGRFSKVAKKSQQFPTNSRIVQNCPKKNHKFSIFSQKLPTYFRKFQKFPIGPAYSYFYTLTSHILVLHCTHEITLA